MIINTDVLKNWPDVASLFDAAASLTDHGAEFAERIDTAHLRWQGLTTCYQSPHQDLLYSALDSAQTAGNQVSDGCLSAGTAMTLFSDTLATLKVERDSLLREVDAHQQKAEPTDPDELAAHNKEAVMLQGRVKNSGDQYREAIENCRDQLRAIGNDGLPDMGHPAWVSVGEDTLLTAMAALSAAGDAARWDIARTTTRFVIHAFGKDRVRLPVWVSHKYEFSFDWGPGRNEGSFLSRFAELVKQPFRGPEIGHFGPPTVVKPGPTGEGIRFGLERSTQLRHTASIVGHVAGKGLFVAGTIFTAVEEYGKTDKRLREQRPELTESERKAEVAQVGTLRAGTQVLSSIAAGAAAGAAIGGPIGFIASIGVGVALNVPVANGKSAAELVADVVEGVFNFARGLFG
ncbi:hypothetical protein [Arachnia propionica]|uniref:Uncharacterized protein n=1 Tax=Arachnia propionica TaxID=1750 RepID=A0A3P1WS94_9ACTN|nr:hypothetical protein [Arachnia propionica]RRD48637.1 hypothetical protein EII35_12015 [Arachnia propionica]